LHASAGARLWHLTWLVTAGAGTYLLAVLAVGIKPRHLLTGHG
jgi:putative peptidoglycan lipid II flippase